MDLQKTAAIFCVVIGVSMIGMWSFFLATGSVPEIGDKPAEIGLHIFAEVLTASLLLIAGYGLIKWKKWGFGLYLVASGLLTYTLIVSPGYYVTLGEPVFVTMFVVFLIIDLIILLLMLKRGVPDPAT